MKLLTYIKTGQHIRKLFGKKELEIIERQLKGMSLTQSEKNRLSRDIRQKLQCIKELAQYQEEFALKKNQENKSLIARAVDIISKDQLHGNIKAILLFGSFADNSFTRHSDIDICVVFNKDISLREATQFRIRISGQLPEKMDIQVFHVLPQKIKKAIARKHKVLYQRKEHDDLQFSIQHLKDEDYFIRMRKIMKRETQCKNK